MVGIADTATSSEFRSDRGAFRREYTSRRNLFDRVQSEDDVFSCDEQTTSTLDEASSLRAVRTARASHALAQLDGMFLEDFGFSLSQASRNDASAFLAVNFRFPEPVLSAEPNGAILATWRAGDQSLVIRFKGGNQVDFAVAFAADQRILRKWGASHFMGFFDIQPEAKRVALSAS